MTAKNKKLPVIVALITIAAAAVWFTQHQSKIAETQTPTPVAANGQTSQTAPAVTELSTETKTSAPNMGDVIAQRTGWNPIFTEYYTKPAPDFAIKGLDGKTYKLSDYKGTDVIVVFWATWCGPCRMEIPHLKELRKDFTDSKLMILAVSNEDESVIKNFVSQQGITYTVLASNGNDLPEPFSMVRSIPSSFFIDTDGNIKLAVVGIVPADQAKAILKATWNNK